MTITIECPQCHVVAFFTAHTEVAPGDFESEAFCAECGYDALKGEEPAKPELVLVCAIDDIPQF